MSRNWSGSALGFSAFFSTSKRSEPIRLGPPPIWNSLTRYAAAISIFSVMFLPPPWPLPNPAVTPLLILLGLIEATSNEGRSPERLCPNEGAPMAAIATTESVNQNLAWSANPDKSTFILLRDTSISLKAVLKILPCGPRSLLPLGDGAGRVPWQRDARRTDLRDSSRAAEQKW